MDVVSQKVTDIIGKYQKLDDTRFRGEQLEINVSPEIIKK
jgi:hypothetical protein